MSRKNYVIAIDRVEKDLVNAVYKYKQQINPNIQCFVLVSTDFKSSGSYFPNEYSKLFTEIIIDFNDTNALQALLKQYEDDEIILHCRLDKAIKDYQKILKLLPNALGPDPASLTLATEKFEMRKAISRRFPDLCPKFIQLDSLEDFNVKLISSFHFPVIVKPNGLHSSLLVSKCEDENQLVNCLEETFKRLHQLYQQEYGTGEPSVLVEEFIEGNMYSIDAYVDSQENYYFLDPVRVITAAEIGLDGYYSYRHILPTDLSDIEIKNAEVACKNALKALGLTSSTAHIELYHTTNGWKIIELGPRIGGYRQDLYYEAFGIDHYFNDLLLHSGQPPVISKLWHKHAAGFNIYASKEGIITAISGVEEARELNSAVYINLHASVGDNAVFASKGGLYLVDGILSNQDSVLLEEDMKKVRELIVFEVK